MLKSTAQSLILRGLLALAIGVAAIALPGATVFALVILFSLYAFIGAGFEGARAFSSRTAGPVLGHLLLGLVSLAAGVLALAWPLPTALVLVLVVASWAVVAGVVEVVFAFRAGEIAGTRARFALTGLVSIAFGAVLFSHPAIGAVTLALLFGLFNVLYGVSAIARGVELRRAGTALHSLAGSGRPARRAA